MKRRYPLALALSLIVTPAAARTGNPAADTARPAPIPAPIPAPVQADVTACFVPQQKCDQAIANEIDAAEHDIRVQAYGFTSPVILPALARAKKRGVDVQAILDKTNKPSSEKSVTYSGATFACNAGIPVWIDSKPAIAHSKLVIIDKSKVIGGSFNYTKSAQNANAENVSFIGSTEVAAWYLTNWEARRAVSQPYPCG